MNAPRHPEVLVCGAGPSGLVLALRLVRAGVRVRIVDAAPGPGTTSRALVVHARTLELYRQMGLADSLITEGMPFGGANLWVRGRRVAHVELGEIGTGLSRFPFMLVVPQDRHERFLVEHLRRAGLEVERQTKLVGFEQGEHTVRATLAHADGSTETCEAAYLAGCDGAHSRVREVLGIGFPGGTYAQYFYVADVEATGPVMNGELHVAVDDADFLAIFPLHGGRTARLVGLARAEREGVPERLGWSDVRSRVIEQLGVGVQKVNWFSTYKVHHRVADAFRRGRVFLVGDAAHIHSPVGGQGMNTGIGDAVNLSWKLAEVLLGRASEEILASYEPERSAFAHTLVDTTDRAFVITTSPGPVARFVRTRIVPRVIPPLTQLTAFKRTAFRVLSQIRIHYRGSPLGEGKAGPIRGGDRLPWVELSAAGGATDNFAGLDGIAWQVHVYGTPGTRLAEACARLDLSLRVFPWSPTMQAAGLTRDRLYLVRPDGYVALVSDANPARLEAFVGTIRGNGKRETPTRPSRASAQRAPASQTAVTP